MVPVGVAELEVDVVFEVDDEVEEVFEVDDEVDVELRELDVEEAVEVEGAGRHWEYQGLE